MFICGLFSSCDTGVKTSDSDIKLIQYPELTKMLQQSSAPADEGFFAFLNDKKSGPTVLIDPRPEKYYAAAHIPHAINLPLPKIVEGMPELAGAKNIVVYAGGWADPLSPASAKRLMALGYANVFDFRGGIEDWKTQGGRIDTAAAESQPATKP